METDKGWHEGKLSSERKSRDQKENIVLIIESASRKEFGDDRLDMSQSNLGEAMKSLESDKDEVEASESKKVRLEADDDRSRLSRRLEILENDNKRLSAELKMIKESKEVSDAKVEALEADKVRLEIELVKERSRRDFAESSSSSDGREKEMNASVAIVSGSSSSRDAATSPDGAVPYFHLSHLWKKKNITKLVQQGRITVTTCNPGDMVLVVWDPIHWSYALLQESSTLYFVNSDCVESLGFTADGAPKIYEAIVEVINKEYCIARKVKSFSIPSLVTFICCYYCALIRTILNPFIWYLLLYRVRILSFSFSFFSLSYKYPFRLVLINLLLNLVRMT